MTVFSCCHGSCNLFLVVQLRFGVDRIGQPPFSALTTEILSVGADIVFIIFLIFILLFKFYYYIPFNICNKQHQKQEVHYTREAENFIIIIIIIIIDFLYCAPSR
jgi:uncharacterized membrane protein